MTGAVLRFIISGWAQNANNRFPTGTLTVNLAGSLILGLIMYLSEYTTRIPADQRIFLTIGMLGAFTTMSTFSFETLRLFEQKEYYLFTLNLIGTNLLCLIGVYSGKFLALKISGL